MEVGDQVWKSMAYLSDRGNEPVAHVQLVTYIGPPSDVLDFMGPMVETATGERYRIGGLSSLHATEAEAKLAAADRLQLEADKIAAVVERLRAEATVAAEEEASV